VPNHPGREDRPFVPESEGLGDARRLDVEIHFVKENEIVSRSSGSSAKLIHGFKVLMAKNVIDNLSEETRKGMLEKARSGIYPSFAL
jgi:hypothetical protein